MACTVGQLHYCSASCERTSSLLVSPSVCACVAHVVRVPWQLRGNPDGINVVMRSPADTFVLLQGSNHASAQTQQSLRANAAAVTSVALEHLLQHLRRGKSQVLWDCVLSEAHTRIESCLKAGTYALHLIHFQTAQTAFLFPFSSAAAQLLFVGPLLGLH